MAIECRKAVLALAAAAVLGGCGDGRRAAAVSEPDEVYVAAPISRPVEIWDDFTARIEAVKSVEIRTRVDGYLEKVNFSEGQLVEEGDLLFVIDRRPYLAKAAAARAGVEEIEARLALARNNLERAKNMYDANAISKEILDTRNAELLAQNAALSSARARLAEAELNLEFTQVRAPISGRVNETRLDEGNLVSADSTLLTTIEKSDVVQAYFEASERDLVRYAELGIFGAIDQKKLVGPEVELRLSSGSKKVFKGMATYFDNRIGDSTSSLTMRADIENPGDVLKPGMFAKLRFKVEGARGALLVREDAIGTDLVGRFVYVVGGDGKVAYRAVEVGRMEGPYRIVNGGISKDDKIIVKGLHNAALGRVVKAVETKMDSE